MAKANKAISLGVSALVVIILVLIVGFGLFVNDTFNTGTTVTSNVTAVGTSTLPSLETNSTTSPTTAITSPTTSSAVVKSSETACIPSSFYFSTTTLIEQSTTTTEQVAYDGTVCNFGDSFEAPSAIMIPANTLVWTNFQLQDNGSYYVGASISFLSLPSALGANITVAVYLNGNLSGSSTTPLAQLPNEVTNSSLMPSSNSTSNSIFALTGVTPTAGVGTQTGSEVNIAGSTISIAFMSDKPLWLCGWTPADMSKGSGPEFGHSMGQLNGTYEWANSGLTLPNSLPQPATTLTFELEISADYSI